MEYFIAVIIISVICGVICTGISSSRGMEGGFWWGFWLWIIGIIVVAVRPNDSVIRSVEVPTYSQVKKQEERILNEGGWKCECGTINPSYVSSCGCGRNKREVLAMRKKENETRESTTVSSSWPEQKTDSEVIDSAQKANSSVEELRGFKVLLDEGVITQEEFDAKKKQILGL